jgi:hypothetical protein
VSWEADAAEVLRLVDAALAVREPVPDAVARAIGVALPKVADVAKFVKHVGTFAGGPFEVVEAWYRDDLGSGTLLLYARPALSPPLLEDVLDLAHFGPKPLPSAELVPPEGVRTYTYDVDRGAREVKLQFAAQSRKLLFASVAWSPRRAAAKAAK